MANERIGVSMLAACPFCSGSFTDARDPITDEANGLMHTMPMCKQFLVLDVLSFITAANNAMKPEAEA